MESDAITEPLPEVPQVERGPPSSTFEQAIDEPGPESEKPPPWFRDTAAKIAAAWFDPKSFEEHPGLYEKLGVRTFKRFMPTGDFFYMSAWKKLTGFEMVTLQSPQTLRNMEIFTRVYEAIHLTGFAVMSTEIGIFLAHQDIKPAVVAGALNTLMNVYPIMVQRYNRARLYRVINKLEEKAAQTPPQPANGSTTT